VGISAQPGVKLISVALKMHKLFETRAANQRPFLVRPAWAGNLAVKVGYALGSKKH
jgi:hypothetical protein